MWAGKHTCAIVMHSLLQPGCIKHFVWLLRYVLLHCTEKPELKKPMKGYARHAGWAVKITMVEEDGVDTIYKLMESDGNVIQYTFGQVNQMKLLSA